MPRTTTAQREVVKYVQGTQAVTGGTGTSVYLSSLPKGCAEATRTID